MESEGSSPVTPDTNCQSSHNGGVNEPGPNDVLCGRGGSINSHAGNERYRQLVDKRKRVYLTARFKREKRLIASSIVSEIRTLDPPGRFLQQEKTSGLWKDIGDEKARDKTSQALRENAPKIRADIEEEINEQRAEMFKEEDRKAVEQQPPPTQASPPPYYPPAWGGYSPYYGYPGAPPPPPPPHSYYPPPPPHSRPPHAHPEAGHWGYYPPPPHPHHPAHPPVNRMPPPPPKSSVQQTADYISLGAESVKKWAESSFSVGGGSSNRSISDEQSVISKPLSYVHQDGSKKRRMVKFSQDTKRTNKRLLHQRHSGSSVNSLTMGIQDGCDGEGDLEPHNMDDDQNNSLMSQVATHILGSIGSWDTASIMCGTDNADRDDAPFPRQGRAPAPVMTREEVDEMQEDDMNVEWEGQEVQLLDRNEQGSVASEDRMQPPPPRQMNHERDSVAFSSLGSCHSWMPEQFESAASSFFGSVRGGSVGQTSHTNDAPMEGMDYSAAGSIGGNSLTRVFEHDVLPDGAGSAMASPAINMSHRVLSQVPSWERSLRSRSPLSVGSADDDDLSLISKESRGSSKMSAPMSPPEITLSPVNSPRPAGDDWGMKE
jgi:hypothetical protein